MPTQGSSFLATLGWRPQPRWGCRELRNARLAAQRSAGRNYRKALVLTRIFHTHFVAHASKPAVARVSKPATRSARPTPRRLGSRRHSRFGNLRYRARGPRVQKGCERSGLTIREMYHIPARVVLSGSFTLLGDNLSRNYSVGARPSGRRSAYPRRGE